MDVNHVMNQRTGVDEIEAVIYESIAKDFVGREEAWDIQARGSRCAGGDPMQVHLCYTPCLVP